MSSARPQSRSRFVGDEASGCPSAPCGYDFPALIRRRVVDPVADFWWEGDFATGIGNTNRYGVSDERFPRPSDRSHLVDCSKSEFGPSGGGRFQGSGVCRPREGVLRSEEHTSELQSRQYLVCRLLLEKKK